MEEARSPFVTQSNPDTNVWYMKPFWRKTWTPAGATTLFGEYGQYNDQLCRRYESAIRQIPAATLRFLRRTAMGPVNLGPVDLSATSIPGDIFKGAFVTGSEVQRWGLGVVQEINSAAMHVFARWQHQTLTPISTALRERPISCSAGVGAFRIGRLLRQQEIGQSFDDWDLFQVGGIIFF